jgi:hypothetical protein
MTKKLPSITPLPSVSTPVVNRVIGPPKHPLPRRIRLRPTTVDDDQRRMERQCQEADVFWKLRMRNRP